MSDIEIRAGHYTVIFEGDRAYFYDDSDPDFSVPKCLAETQQQRDECVKLYQFAHTNGEACGRRSMQYEIKRVLGM